MDANTQAAPMEDTRNNRIGVMLQVLNQLMEDCEEHSIAWSNLLSAAENLWSVRNGKYSSYDCGRVTGDDDNAIAVPAGVR